MPEEMEFGHDIFGYTTLVRDNDVFVALTGRDVAQLRVGMKVVLLGDSRGYVPSGFSPGDEVMIVGFAEPFKGGTSDHIVQVTKDSERGWVKPSNIQRGLSAPTAKPTNPLPSGLPGLSSEFIQVDFPEPRDVLVDGMVLGTTGKALLVPRGTHVVSLGGEQNYSMQVTPISVVNTTFTTPLIITATLNAQTAPPSAQKRVALLVTPEVAGVVAAVLSELN
ncbi:MAG TPA: hypothetical protein VNF91_01570, partial [Candidatus Acidoferrum sp.]|nr:hypothetical protein [Candidatus Acidoferrum sp.]